MQTHAPPYLLGSIPADSSQWTYNKTEDLTPELLTASRDVTHAIAELMVDGARNSFEATGLPGGNWRLTGVITAYERIRRDFSGSTLFSRPWEAIQLVKSEQLAILEKK